MTDGLKAPYPVPSTRALKLDPPYIENVLDAFAGIPDTANLAMGVSHWGPPPHALEAIAELSSTAEKDGMTGIKLHGYGAITGAQQLQAALRQKLAEENGLDLTNQEVMVTAGANQACTSLALALCDPGDEAVLVAPYYMSHLLALQIAQAEVRTCRWDPATLLPDLKHLEDLLSSGRVKAVILTTPGNPTGAVCTEQTMLQIVRLCQAVGAWLIVDQTYEHFLHDGATHVSPCAERVGYQGLVHVFSMSKDFGMAGWRLGYMVYPKSLHASMRSIQDTIPTHAAMVSQRVGLAALDPTEGKGGTKWVKEQVADLHRCREHMWSVLAKHAPGTVRTNGAFYFLVRLPSHVSEEDAVKLLATEYRVLVTPGRAFGAPGHVRVSYGSLREDVCLAAIDRLEKGLEHMSREFT